MVASDEGAQVGDRTMGSPLMPAKAPLAMPLQNLRRPFVDPQAKPIAAARGIMANRALVFLPAFATTIALIAVLLDWFAENGFAPLEIVMLVLAGFSAFWIALSVSTSTLGLFSGTEGDNLDLDAGPALDVALLVPVFEEDAHAVARRLSAMRDELAFLPSRHRYAFFVLSDTQNPAAIAAEEPVFRTLAESSGDHISIHYRRRASNIERKTGNIRDWVQQWGEAWDAFITLDADSLMGAGTINTMANRLAADPSLGLLQTVPHLIGGNSLFARVQQFANNVHGGVLARGVARMSGPEGNYWGHNAIIRTRAFAACCGLPKLAGHGPLSGTIKSHDFVEAALLRRAGWAVRLWAPQDESDVQSYEEVPQTLIDYVLRDRRWCQGNLQHLRLLAMPGLKFTSAFHMVQGAMAYIASLVWFALLVLWAVMGRNEEQNVLAYFTDANPMFPRWPEMDVVSRAMVLGFMIALLLTPKLFSIASHWWADPTCRRHGGVALFIGNSMLEIALSVVLAPIMMVQHVIAVLRTIVGLDAGWAPQNRSGGRYSWAALLRFHALETVIGVALLAGIGFGIVTLWLLPIALCLAAAVPISRAFSHGFTDADWLRHVLETPEMRSPSLVMRGAGQDVPAKRRGSARLRARPA